VRTVVVTSAKDKVFCSGANIFMLGVSSHAWKVNFCKFTNETRNGLEDSSAHSGLKFLAAVNGACAGGGYELALACDEIILVDDRSSAVSLPEVPLLGVLPGTGGLTRVTDKRQVRHDLADIFCTSVEGVRGQKAKDWRLVDDIAKPAQFAAKVQERALQLAALSDRPADGKGVTLPPLQRVEADALRYQHVTVEIDRAKRTATFTVKAPAGAQPTDIAGIEAAGADWYPLAMAASWKTPSCRCAPTSSTSAPGSSRPKATPPPCWPWTPRCWRTSTTGWCARPSACCAAPSAGWTCLAAACLR
jgi:benzoyl-CoA-dihydrodiol lyase